MDTPHDTQQKANASGPSKPQPWNRDDSIKNLAVARLFFAAFGILPRLLIST
jgi:hypothetical protein